VIAACGIPLIKDILAAIGAISGTFACFVLFVIGMPAWTLVFPFALSVWCTWLIARAVPNAKSLPKFPKKFYLGGEGVRQMQQVEFDMYRYGLATLLVRRPHLRAYAPAARWWADLVEEYGLAVRYRDKLCVEGDHENELAEYEHICREIEDELQDYLSACVTHHHS
jgi:hypothetical protein